MLKEFYNKEISYSQIEDFVSNIDHHSEAFKSNYFNIIERVTGREPAFRSFAYNDGFTIVTSAELAQKVAALPDLFSNVPGSRVVPNSLMPVLYPSDLDGEMHQTVRRVLNPLFAPKPMREIGQQAAVDADVLIEAAKKRGYIDFVEDLGQPVTGRASM